MCSGLSIVSLQQWGQEGGRCDSPDIVPRKWFFISSAKSENEQRRSRSLLCREGRPCVKWNAKKQDPLIF